MKFNGSYFRGKDSSYRRGYEIIEAQIKNFVWPLILKYIDLQSGVKVLDVGCAYGYLLTLFDSVGCETYGVDVSEHAIEQARSITKAKLYVSDIEKWFANVQDNFFDLITMLHVIEHLRSPYNVLKEI